MAQKNAEFYSQDIVLRVEDELFKVSKQLFIQQSQVFRDMFDIPQPEGIEPDGSSDERPLILEGIEKRDFIQLLRFLYPKVAGQEFSLDQWKSVLKLSDLYGMIEVKNSAVDYMTPLVEAQSPSLQIHLAQMHNVPKWLQLARTRLVERKNLIDENDLQLIGPTFALEVCALREKALQERELEERALVRKAFEEKVSLEIALGKPVLDEKSWREKELRKNSWLSWTWGRQQKQKPPRQEKPTSLPAGRSYRVSRQDSYQEKPSYRASRVPSYGSSRSRSPVPSY